MNHEEKLIIDILLWLARAGANKKAPNTRQRQQQDVLTYISTHYHKCATVQDLETIRRRAEAGEIELGELEDKFAYIILPPAEHNGGFVPIININYKHEKDPPEMRIRTGLFMFNQFQGSKPSSIGFRLEPPEGGGDGHHDYFHAQFIRNLQRSPSEPDLTWPSYVPTSQPAFPVYANGPLTLLFSTLIAIYGKRYLIGEFLRDFSDNDFLRARMAEWPPARS